MDNQQMLEIGLTFLALVLSYALQRAKWPASTNTIIAGVAVLVSAAVTVFVQGKLTGNVVGDAVLIVAAASALQAKSLAPLMQYLIENFPANSKPSQPEPAPVAPAPIQLSTPPTAKDLTSGN